MLKSQEQSRGTSCSIVVQLQVSGVHVIPDLGPGLAASLAEIPQGTSFSAELR